MEIHNLGKYNNIIYRSNSYKSILKHFKQNPNDSLSIDGSDVTTDTLNHVVDLIKLGIYKINFSSIRKKDESLIYCTTNIEELSLASSDFFPVDFLGFKNLKKLGYIWLKGTSGLENLSLIEYIFLLKYKADDMSLFSNYKLLKRLRLSQSSILSLNGIENLKELKDLTLAYCRNLEDLSTFKGNPNVEILDITSCKKLDVNILPNYFPNVHTLTIESQGEIATIEPLLKGFSKLKQIKAIENTKILDAKTNANYQNLLKDKRYYIKGIGTSKDW